MPDPGTCLRRLFPQVRWWHRLPYSFHESPRYITATSSLFHAGKAEEMPKKGRDLIKTVCTPTNNHHFGIFGQVESCNAFLPSLGLIVLTIV
jgi:hypothetical protein